MLKNFMDRAFKWLFAGLLLTILAAGFAMAMPSYSRSQELKRRSAELSARIEEKKREIEELNDFQRRFKDDADFVESIARQNRRVFPGELVFVFKETP